MHAKLPSMQSVDSARHVWGKLVCCRSVADPEGFMGFALTPLPAPVFEYPMKNEIIWSQ